MQNFVLFSYNAINATPRNDRLTPLRAACLHIFRYPAQILLEIGRYYRVGFIQADEKSDGAIIVRCCLNSISGVYHGKKITVVPYDSKWACEFKKIKNELFPVIGDNVIAIEHVGSTSVEGLWAKPVIDIDIVIDNENLPVIIKKLAEIGYCHKGDLGISGREAFGYNDEEKSHLMKHHLYVCQKDNAELKRHLALRDFLRNNCEYREKYGNIKREMAKKFPNDIESYILGKQPIVMEIYSMCVMNN